MNHIRLLFIGTILLSVLFYNISCTKDKAYKAPNNTIVNHKYIWADRIAQDSAFRMGKWYCINLLTNQTRNPDLDTIWFINDTLAGWTGFNQNSNAYVFSKTYFPDFYHITHIYPDPLYSNITDSVTLDCGMDATQDTFGIYYHGLYVGDPPYLQEFVKMK